MEGSYWGLAAWYPPGVRSAMMNQEKGTPTKKHKKAKRKPEATPKPKRDVIAGPKTLVTDENAVPAVESKLAFEGSPYKRTLAFLTANPLATHSLEKISRALGLKTSVAAMNLGKLVETKKAEKTSSGTYRAYTEKAQEMPVAG